MGTWLIMWVINLVVIPLFIYSKKITRGKGLILLFLYLGYMALWAAIEDPDTAADLTSVLCLVGSVFALLSRYAVLFWNQGLHQGASLSLDKEENVADVFYQPLLFCIAGFVLLFIALVLLRTRTEIRARRIRALELLREPA